MVEERISGFDVRFSDGREMTIISTRSLCEVAGNILERWGGIDGQIKIQGENEWQNISKICTKRP